MTVYVTQRPRPNKRTGWMPDMTSAAKYGKLDYVFEDDENVSRNPSEWIDRARFKLKNFDPDYDYILVTPSSLVGDEPGKIVQGVILCMGYSYLTYLNWSRHIVNGERDRNSGEYLPIKYNFEERGL